MVSIAMPLVIVNLGAEMIYILDQRLKAQCIAEDKSRQVLNDVVRTWFDNKFVEALFKPQQLYSLAATREVFERLAHSSIMRLNSSRYNNFHQVSVKLCDMLTLCCACSMEKLFDLMVMGLKYQVLACQQAQGILQVTSTLHMVAHVLHLEAMRQYRVSPAIQLACCMYMPCALTHQRATTYVQITLLHLHSVRKLLSDAIVQHAVDVVEVRVKSLYEPLPLGQWRLLRQTLCRFFQNRRIKVKHAARIPCTRIASQAACAGISVLVIIHHLIIHLFKLHSHAHMGHPDDAHAA